MIGLDDKQVLTLKAEDALSEDRVLRVTIRGGRCDWTEYGEDRNAPMCAGDQMTWSCVPRSAAESRTLIGYL